MSNTRKHLVDRIEDITLGAFGNLPPSEKLNHLVRYLSTWSGSDKLFMLIQYGAKREPVFNYRAGLRGEPTSALSSKLAKLAGIVGDARTLWGIWGILPTVQWLMSLERASPPTRRLLTIERTQGWAMLAFYHLQNLSYLRTHDLVPAALSLPAPSGKRYRDRALLLKQHRAINRLGPKERERAELARRWDAWYNELAVNLSYLPMTIHWSLEKGIFQNDAWVSLFGFAAAIASFRSGWKATALPPPARSAESPSPQEPEAEETSSNSDEQQGSTAQAGYEIQ
ncbi:hypothetical protein F5148DRAFT_1300871 [Russula earlei]|uniref:Uncharacterized protein n=1 Tax=Russula earlei TaxID=71964 RepID=A0ACC0TYZ1_9AGAM|nr:hypothetical protein F5148DRAFT_1300871 [Russula earlei]